MHKLGNIIEVNNPSYLCKKDKTKQKTTKMAKKQDAFETVLYVWLTKKELGPI